MSFGFFVWRKQHKQKIAVELGLPNEYVPPPSPMTFNVCLCVYLWCWLPCCAIHSPSKRRSSEQPILTFRFGRTDKAQRYVVDHTKIEKTLLSPTSEGAFCATCTACMQGFIVLCVFVENFLTSICANLLAWCNNRTRLVWKAALFAYTVFKLCNTVVSRGRRRAR